MTVGWLFAFLLPFVLLHCGAGEVTTAIAELYGRDIVPQRKMIKAFKTSSKPMCAVSCVNTKSCYSFSFGFGDCCLWDAKYKIEDKLMKNSTGHVYYHLNPIPEPTAIKISDTVATYDAASKACQRLKQGSLLTIHNNNTQSKLVKLMKSLPDGSTVWIGMAGTIDYVNGRRTLKGAALDFDLRWVDGHVFTAGRYTHFLSQDPNLDGYNCILVLNKKLGYRWVDEGCGVLSYYACQFAP